MYALPLGTALFAGRYEITAHCGKDGYGYIYKAVDINTGEEVDVHEFFPGDYCRRAPQSGAMTIVRAHAQAAQELYRSFSGMVASRKSSGDSSLLHAFKDNGTAYYVTAASVPGQVRTAKSAPAAATVDAAAKEKSKDPCRKERTMIASYRYAILWYRIIIGLLAAIVLLLIYLHYLTPSPRVSAAHVPDVPAVAAPADSLAIGQLP